jgi:hypothetical protein
MVKCPFPGCTHVGDLITNAHCKMKHGMTKKEVFEKHGDPIPVKKDDKNRTAFNKWLKEQSNNVSSMDFNGIEAAVGRLNGRRKGRKDI